MNHSKFHYSIHEIQAKKEGISIHEELTPEFLKEWVNLSELDVTQTKLVVTATLVKSHEQLITLSGGIAGKLVLECYRCLDPATVVLQGDLNVLFLPHAKRAEEEKEFHLEEPDFEYYHPKDGIDLGHVFREQILLNIPLSVLCKPECHGLCLSCGSNLNTDLDNCSCEKK